MRNCRWQQQTKQTKSPLLRKRNHYPRKLGCLDAPITSPSTPLPSPSEQPTTAKDSPAKLRRGRGRPSGNVLNFRQRWGIAKITSTPSHVSPPVAGPSVKAQGRRGRWQGEQRPVAHIVVVCREQSGACGLGRLGSVQCRRLKADPRHHPVG